MLKTMFRSWFVRSALVGTAVFVVAAHVLPNMTLMVGLRIAQMAVAMAVIVAYSRDIWIAMMAPRPDPYQRILLGIEGSFVAIMLSALIAYLWRITGEPRWMVHMDLTGFPIWISIQAGVMHLWARGALAGGLPTKERIQIGIVIAVGLLLGLALMTRSGEVGSVLEALRPYLEEH